MKKNIFLIFVLLAVAACGSSSNAPDESQLNITPSVAEVIGTNDASDVITFEITGGTPPYTVVSSDTDLIPSPVLGRGQTKFSVHAPPVTQQQLVVLTVTDSVGITAEARVLITFAPLSLVADGPTTIFAPDGQTFFTISGGVPPFTVSSFDNTVITVNIFGRLLTITGINPGATTVKVTDSAIVNPLNPSVHQTATTPTITVKAPPK